jgi:16S rRNA (adenine1518-N6/adenine1519-N6)-dimethyltransferase
LNSRVALDALPPLRDVIARHRLSAKKAFGQNFLFDTNLLDKIVRVPGDLRAATVYEVGPGPGGLTRALLRAGATVTAVEMDRRCLPALAELAGVAPLKVVEGDALDIDEVALLGGPAHVVANLPYNVGTALLTRWLTVDPWPPWWLSLTLMFQREVADRIVARPGDPAYGRLSVLAQWRSRSRIVLGVPARAFIPPPKVDSAVVHIVPGEAPGGVSVRALERLTAAAFGQRRKMLRSSLKALPGAIDALARVGIDGERRAETLAVGEFVALARALPSVS